MSLPFPTVILFSILPRRLLFPKPLAQVWIHPCHNLPCSLLVLLVFFPCPSQHFLSIKPSYTAELCTVSEELAQGRPCQGPLSWFNSVDDWIRGFGTAFSVLMKLNQSCNSLGSFASLLPFPSEISTILLLPTLSSCSRDVGCRTDEAMPQPPWLVSRMHYQGTVKIRIMGLGDAYTYRTFLDGKNKKS